MTQQANQEIRKELKRNGVRQWQLAEALGVCEFTLCKRLRHELPEEEKLEALNAIHNIMSRKENG